MRRTKLTPPLSEAYAWKLLYEDGMGIVQIAREHGRSWETVSRALDWIGVKRLRGTLIQEHEVDEMVRLYETGMSFREVAEAVGRAERTVLSWLHRRGVVRTYQATMPEALEMRRLYESGLSMGQVAQRTGRSTSTVKVCLNALDVKRRRSRVTDEEAAEMVALYASRRMSMTEVAQRTGRSMASVHRVLRRQDPRVMRINKVGRNIHPTIQRTPHDQVVRILETYRITQCQKETARLLGISNSTVRYHLVSAGEPILERPDVARLVASRWKTPDDVEEMVCRMYSAGVSFIEMGETAGLSHSTISNIIKRRKVPLRGRGAAVRRAWYERRELVAA